MIRFLVTGAAAAAQQTASVERKVVLAPDLELEPLCGRKQRLYPAFGRPQPMKKMGSDALGVKIRFFGDRSRISGSTNSISREKSCVGFCA